MEDPLASLIAVGQKALQSGAVTPKQAAKNVKKLNPVLKAAGITSDPIDLIRKRNAAAVAAIANTPDGQMPGTTNVQNPVTGNWSNVPDSTMPQAPLAELAPVAKGSGLSNSVKNYAVNTETTGLEDINKDLTRDETGRETSNRNTVSSNLYMTPEELQQLTSGVEGTDFIGRQRQGIEDMQDLLTMEAQRPTDIMTAPLAGLLQMEFGRNPQAFLQGKGLSPQEQGARLLAYQGKIQDDKRDLAAKVLDTVGKMKSGTATENAFQLWRDKQLQEMMQQYKTTEGTKNVQGTEAKAEAEDPNSPRVSSAGIADLRIKERDLRESINKTMEPLDVGYNQLLNAKEALDRNDYQSTVGILSILAKNVGADAGALSNQDLTRWLPRTFGGDLAKVEAYFTSNPNAEISPELTSGLKKLVEIAAKNMVNRYDKQLNRKLDQYKGSASYRGVNLDDIASPSRKAIAELRKYGGFTKDAGPLKNATNGSKSEYNGSTTLPEGATESMKAMRRDYLKKKAGG